MKFLVHVFKFNETVEAILKKYNNYPSKDVIIELYKIFIEENGRRVFYPGDMVRIPIIGENND